MSRKRSNTKPMKPGSLEHLRFQAGLAWVKGDHVKAQELEAKALAKFQQERHGYDSLGMVWPK